MGGNCIFGFVPIFTAKYCCRICFCEKKELHICTKEITQKLRTINQHTNIINKITAGLPEIFDSKGKLDAKKTLGITNYCILNDLNYFTSIENRSQDPMHDIFEGAMPFVLRRLFDYFSAHGVIANAQIVEKIRSFHYGILDRRNIPSTVFLKKKNLNQNASQMHCLLSTFHSFLQTCSQSKIAIRRNIFTMSGKLSNIY